MKLFKHKIAMFYVLLVLAGGGLVSSCEDANEEILPTLDQAPTEDDDGSPNPPPCPSC